MEYVRLRYGYAYVNADELPVSGGPYLLSLTARQVRIARSFLFPWSRSGNRLVRPVDGDLYQTATDSEVTAFTDDLDELETQLGGVPEMLLWAGTPEIAGVAGAESAGTSDTVPRGDHVHALLQDVAIVSQLVGPGGVARWHAGSPDTLYADIYSGIGMQAHVTASIASGGTIVNLFNSIYATGILFLSTSVSSVAAVLALHRGSCVALGTLPANITTTKDVASKLNVYYDSDNIVKAQNNYSTALTLRLLWLGAALSALINPDA